MILTIIIDAQDGKNLIVQLKDSLLDKSINVIIDSIILNDKILLDSTEIKIQIPQEPDTTYLQILNPQQNLSIIPNNIDGVNIDLIFSKPVQLSTDSTLAPKIFINDSTEFDILIEQKNPMYYTIKPTKMWEQNEKYKLILNRDGITTEFGKGIKDSLHMINISTGKSMGFGGVIGQINAYENDNVLVELFSAEKSIVVPCC